MTRGWLSFIKRHHARSLVRVALLCDLASTGSAVICTCVSLSLLLLDEHSCGILFVISIAPPFAAGLTCWRGAKSGKHFWLIVSGIFSLINAATASLALLIYASKHAESKSMKDVNVTLKVFAGVHIGVSLLTGTAGALYMSLLYRLLRRHPPDWMFTTPEPSKLASLYKKRPRIGSTSTASQMLSSLSSQSL